MDYSNKYVLLSCESCGTLHLVSNGRDGYNCLECKGVLIPKETGTRAELQERYPNAIDLNKASEKKFFKQYIDFVELDKYMLRPVYDNEQKRWKVLKGYAKVEGDKKVMFTETNFLRGDIEWVTYTDTLLSDHDKN